MPRAEINIYYDVEDDEYLMFEIIKGMIGRYHAGI